MDDMLIFHIGTIRCGIPLSATYYVIGMVQVQTSSCGDESGEKCATINLHGEILPVYSLRKIFGLPDRPPQITDNLIIVQGRTGLAALWVDGVEVMRGSTLLPDSGAFVSDEGSGIFGAHLTGDGVLMITDLVLFLEGTSHELLPGNLRSRFPIVESCETPMEDRNDDQVQAILTDRAGKLARQTDEATEREPMEILRFRLMYQEYAIEMNYIQEAVLTGEITPVPGTPAYITGICAIRGEIVSLVDLRILFALPEKGLTDLNRVIVLTNGTITFGILADAITGTGSISRQRVVPARPDQISLDSRFVLGITDEQVIVLDAAAIIADPRMIVDQGEGDPQIPW
ncbi:MAG: chemotaxis protein CheW [Methanoregulaceae archaeon]